MTLFAWQRALIAARDLPDAVFRTAIRIGLDSTSSTGRDVVLNAAQIALDLDCSERTVWRRLQQLVDAGWIVQTAKPTLTRRGAGGRRAVYALTIPGELGPESSDTVPLDAGTRPPDSSDTARRDLSRDSRDSSASSPAAVSDDPAESSDTSTLNSSATTSGKMARFSTTTGDAAAAAGAPTTTNRGAGLPAERRPLPTSVEILRGKLEANLLVVRWDRLNDDQVDAIERLVELHGDAPLIRAAKNAWRAESPAVFAQAWIGTWEALPPPGRALSLVPPAQQICTTHGTKRSDSGVCSSCEADRKAGDR